MNLKSSLCWVCLSTMAFMAGAVGTASLKQEEPMGYSAPAVSNHAKTIRPAQSQMASAQQRESGPDEI